MSPINWSSTWQRPVTHAALVRAIRARHAVSPTVAGGGLRRSRCRRRRTIGWRPSRTTPRDHGAPRATRRDEVGCLRHGQRGKGTRRIDEVGCRRGPGARLAIVGEVEPADRPHAARALAVRITAARERVGELERSAGAREGGEVARRAVRCERVVERQLRERRHRAPQMASRRSRARIEGVLLSI